MNIHETLAAYRAATRSTTLESRIAKLEEGLAELRAEVEKLKTPKPKPRQTITHLEGPTGMPHMQTGAPAKTYRVLVDGVFVGRVAGHRDDPKNLIAAGIRCYQETHQDTKLTSRHNYFEVDDETLEIRIDASEPSSDTQMKPASVGHTLSPSPSVVGSFKLGGKLA